MTRYCISKYPKGSFKGQRIEGRYIDEALYFNLKGYASKIVKDMTFLGVLFSSTLEVGTGKSTFAQQVGECWTELVNDMHKLDSPITFTIKNIVFSPKDLIDRAFELPKYSCLILDEWEDLHYWSELGVTLRQFFRKCRQLNLFIIVIIPDWFQLPRGYAISRSAFAVDVYFEDGYERGFFKFYGFPTKRKLYVNGKKDYNFNVVRADIVGSFNDGYAVPREEYLEQKRKDLERYDEEGSPLHEKQMKTKEIVWELNNKFNLKTNELAKLWKVHERTIERWIFDIKNNAPTLNDGKGKDKYNNIPTNNSENFPEQEQEE